MIKDKTTFWEGYEKIKKAGIKTKILIERKNHTEVEVKKGDKSWNCYLHESILDEYHAYNAKCKGVLACYKITNRLEELEPIPLNYDKFGYLIMP